jgi:tetratricopeptide (TPR) repeat protein
VLLVTGCSLEKKSAVNRGLQNLTAHYNILFNANEILRQKQDSYALSFVDSYNEILSVYQDTTPKTAGPDKDLEEAKVKANKIINIKEQSHYLGDAYLVLGKANYLEGDYFQAAEFFSYVIRSFPKETKLTEEATIWKARTLIYLNQLPQAKLVADSAIQNINKKTKKAIIADAYATKLQYDIDVQNYTEGETMAQQAIHYCRDKKQRLRWMFIMAQLQELNNKPKDAFANYTRIMNSNASFEMAFNASLNRIRIEENANGVKENRIDRLRGLIKNENNKDYLDQIYYQIGDQYLVNKDYDNAIKNYHLSTHFSRKNQNQKGMSYLRLADIYFNNRVDYPRAKKYYDSTLLNLSPTYPGYQVIRKKNNNLQLLTDRLETIAREDTLQMLAKLDDKTRAKHIDAMVNREILQQQAQAIAEAPVNESTGSGGLQAGSSGASTFYFYNSNAVSLGYADFKRRWGNRKLEDNWRRSNRASSDITNSSSQNPDPDAPAGQMAENKGAPTAGAYRKQLTDNLPLTPALLVQSNQRIYNAYADIANFYRDVLGDKKDAIATDEILLSRFPNTPDKPAIYYNLYRLYSDVDPSKADQYKNLLLKEFPETAFAKIIVDPNYIKNVTDSDAEINALYNNVYDSFAKKDYKNTIILIDQLQQQRPGNKWSAQLAYLRAISAGHLEKLDAFKADLTDILTKYPTDKLIVPLVQQHLAYVNAHQPEMQARQFALIDKDPNEEPFVPPVEETKPVGIADYNAFAEHQQQAAKQAQAEREAAAKKAAAKNGTANLPDNKQLAVTRPDNNNPAKRPSIFSMRDSTNYYFVVNVNTGTTNLASSRFGIGQFNRANFPNGSITHQLMAVADDNQLIFVGRFYTLNDVKDYARNIIPLMPDIMKIPKEKYSFFIITKENLDKLTSKAMLDSYMDYYQNNY